MINQIKYTTLVCLLLLSPMSMAIDRWGEFNKTYKYDNLKIHENNNGTCTIEGKVINTTRELKDGVYIKIFAFDIHGSLDWSNILFVSAISPNGEADFSDTILKCTESNPYKMSFKVTD